MMRIVTSLVLAATIHVSPAAEPTFNRASVPAPVFEQEPGYVDLYYKAWELAFDHIKHQEGMPQTPYMDEAFADSDIWIWDTCFMVQFCKYAPETFPGIQSLNNFYKPIHDGATLPVRLHLPDNPPLFAWTELQYAKVTGNQEHVNELINNSRYLQKHFLWFANKHKPKLNVSHHPIYIRPHPKGFFWEGGRSGMDNTPRGRRGKNARPGRPNNPKMLWLDAYAQQGLSALCISRLAEQSGNHKEARKWKVEYEKIKTTINTHYWDEKDGIYYDIHSDTLEPMKCKTPAAYWPMLAEMCDAQQAARLVDHLKDPKVFGGLVPFPTVSRDDPDFNPAGRYWRGGVWLPTSYMATKALEKYGYQKEAGQAAEKLLAHMLKTYREYKPATIWECYSPTEFKPSTNEHGKTCRPDFCGWSALGPISLFIENVLGFHTIDAQKKEIHWHKHQPGLHGIRNLKFGNITTTILAKDNSCTVHSTAPYTLVVNNKKLQIKKGLNTFGQTPPPLN